MAQSSSIYELVKQRPADPRRYACQFQLFSQRVLTQLYHHFRGPGIEELRDTALAGRGRGDAESPYGAVFNLDFSPADDLLVAVHANRAILTYDPRTCSRVGVVPHAHEDCVNCITFLDHLTFATCSDDHTIRLWDLRSLRGSTAVLSGHTDWVKNIEYDKRSGLLFSVAFHDGVRVWDLDKVDSYSEADEVDNLVLKFKDPVRMRISPEGSRMFISTRKNVCLVIEQFDARRIQEITAGVEKLMRLGAQVPKETIRELSQRKNNRPVFHCMSGLEPRSFRAVMSAAFQSDGLLGLRHIDVSNGAVNQELTTLYDVRTTDDSYTPYLTVGKCQKNYLKYVDEDSPIETLNFIKEISFSRDGRVLASPCELCVRLLAVDPSFTPADVYFDDRYHSRDKALCSLEFEEIRVSCHGHTDPVLTCKFANNDCLLATGCLRGNVNFHWPRL